MSMFGNGDAEWDAETYAAEKAEFHRLREKLKLGNDFWTPLEWAKSLHAEVERLRADNKWLLEQAKQNETVRAEQAKQLRALLAELDWFRRRKTLSDELQSVYAALSESHDAIVEATGKLFDFDLTKPGAGT